MGERALPGFFVSRAGLFTYTGAVKSNRHILMIFVDGLGIGAEDPAVNPVHSGACPCIEGLLASHSVSIDATLGVPGLPQSATGQTTLLTGMNAAQAMGRHVEGFPNRALKDIIRAHNVYAQLAGLGLSSTFANAY